jgi:hypothetical protein
LTNAVTIPDSAVTITGMRTQLMIHVSPDFGGTFRIFKIVELSLDEGVS